MLRRMTGWQCAWPAFALGCWFVGYFWFLGDLGKWRDDYWQSQFRPWLEVSRAWAWPWDVKQEFWRPLHFVLVTNMGTYWWDLDWARHLVTAIACGGAAVAAWLLGRRVFASPHAAWALGMGVLTAPIINQIAFWPAAASTAIALGLFFVACMAIVAYARPDRSRRRWLWLIVIAAAIFACACFNEQPVGGALGAPVLAFGVARSGRVRAAMRTAIARAAWATMAASIGALAYVVPFVLTRRPNARGGAETLADPAQVPGQVGRGLSRLWMESFGWEGRGLISQSLPRGLEALASPIGLLGAAGLAIVAALALLAAMGRPILRGRDEVDARAISPAALVAFAALALVGMTIPPALVAGGAIPTRVLYGPGAMLLLALAAFGDGLARPAVHGPRFGRVLSASAGALVVGLSLVGTLTLLGVQGFNHDRARFERMVAQHLIAALPEPPRGTAYLCLGNAFEIVPRGVPAIGRLNLGLLANEYALEFTMQRHFGRRDLLGFAHHRHGNPVHRSVGDGMLELIPLTAATAGKPMLHEAGRVLAFAVEPDGAPVIARGLWLEDALGRDGFSPTLAGSEAGPAWSLRAAADAQRMFGDWTHSATGRGGLEPRDAWFVRRPAYELEAGDTLSRPVRPLASGRSVLMRVTLNEQDAREDRGPMLVVATLDGEEIARTILHPRALVADRRWLPMLLDLRGLPAEAHLAIEVRALGNGPSSRVLVDRGAVLVEGDG